MRPNDEDLQRYERELGDDEQEFEIAETERYIEDPPDDLVIEEPEDGPVGIREWNREETRRGDPPPDDRPAEDAALHEEDFPR